MSHQFNEENMAGAGAFFLPSLSLRWYSQLDSTNSLALNEPGLPGGTVIAADSQWAGRGRLGRNWLSPQGLNLYFSLVLYPQLPREHWGGFSLAAGVGLAQGLGELDLHPRIKWPNDILWQGIKMAGILLETKEQRLVVGAGVNVNQEEFPLGLHATSIRIATGIAWRRDLLLAVFSREIYRWCMLWEQGLFDQVISAWRQHDSVLGQQVTIHRGEEAIEGTAVDVESSGALVVEDRHAFRHVLHSGEVSFRKN